MRYKRKISNMKYLMILVFIFSFANVSAQNDTIRKIEYSFIIKGSPSQLFSMRQFNQGYLSGYRLFARSLYSHTKKENVADIIQLTVNALLFGPLSHEEGHRSILTGNNIGSISQPYFNKYGAAYIKGVTDKTLQNLRDKDLPTFIRLHTGGLESDYMLTKRVEALGSFEQDSFRNYKWEYWMRKLALIQYYASGLLKYKMDFNEEINELDRDIVGHDLYGATRHLFRPSMNFYRYTRYNDLTKSEKQFIKRLGYRSFLNILNPLIIGRGNFRLYKSTKINIGMGYTMSPFGDFIDENIWVKHGNIYMSFYARQFQNKENWFNGFGITLYDLKPVDKIAITLSGHFWQQPKNYSFNTSEYFLGGAVDTTIKYWFTNKQNIGLAGYSIDLGIIYKTEGFLPEEVNLNRHFGIRIGTSLRL